MDIRQMINNPRYTWIRIVVMISCWAFQSDSLSAQYLQIKELDQAGRTVPVTNNRRAIDINSKLLVSIDKKEVRSAALSTFSFTGESTIDSVILALEAYKIMIESIEASVQIYQDVVTNPNRTMDDLESALSDRAIAGLNVLDHFPEDSRFANRFEEELNVAVGGSTNEQFWAMIRVVDEEVDHSEQLLDRLISEEGIAFQMAAWSVTASGPKQLHLEGFDTLQQGEFFEYQRNRLFLTEEQLASLHRLNSIFASHDKNALFENLIGLIPGFLSKAIDISAIQAYVNTLRTFASELEADAIEQKEELLRNINKLEEDKTRLAGMVSQYIAKYSQAGGVAGKSSGIEVLLGFHEDVGHLKIQTELIIDDIRGITGFLSNLSLPSHITNLMATIKSGEGILKQSLKDLSSFARESYHTAVYGRRINSNALELSEKMLRLDIGQIPNSTTLDLLYGNKREPGDKIVFKAFLWKGKDTKPAAVEQIELPMVNALPHVQMNIAYTFARPVYNGGRFKGGPTVSVLYKFRSRSLAYRNFFDPGIGFHAASYDFNSDDTPEFAGGLILSAFRDYVQGGWGFNFNANSGYWFVGLRIPIPTSPVSLFGQ